MTISQTVSSRQQRTAGVSQGLMEGTITSFITVAAAFANANDTGFRNSHIIVRP